MLPTPPRVSPVMGLGPRSDRHRVQFSLSACDQRPGSMHLADQREV